MERSRADRNGVSWSGEQTFQKTLEREQSVEREPVEQQRSGERVT